MGNFTLSEKFNIEFDGDTIEYELERADNATMKSLAPFIETQQEGVKVSFESQLDAIEEMGNILSKYANFVRPPIDKYGSEIPVEVIYSKQYFLPLVSDMFNNLMMISNLTVTEAKKSGSTSPTEATGSTDIPQLESVG